MHLIVQMFKQTICLYIKQCNILSCFCGHLNVIPIFAPPVVLFWSTQKISGSLGTKCSIVFTSLSLTFLVLISYQAVAE